MNHDVIKKQYSKVLLRDILLMQLMAGYRTSIAGTVSCSNTA